MSIVIDSKGVRQVEDPLKAEFARLHANNVERRQACLVAAQALKRLVDVLRARTGQSYKVRALLYSLYNGQPASLLEIVNLDWEIRKDLVAVILAFGYEGQTTKFFYNAVREALEKSGQWAWFIEEFKEEQ